MPPPSPTLRHRILEEARRERADVVPLRPRWALRAAAAVVAVTACAAIGLGVWAASLHDQLGKRPEAVRVNGVDASVIITPENEATLVVRSLPSAPIGKTYEAWVIQGDKPAPPASSQGEAASPSPSRARFQTGQSSP